MPISRAVRFLRKVFLTLVLLAAAALALALVQYFCHPFGKQIEAAKRLFANADSLAGKEMLRGISLGMIAFVAAAGLFPLLLKGVDRKQYLVATQRAVIASVILFFSQMLYNWVRTFGFLHLIITMAASTVIALVLIETFSLLIRDDKQVAFRTDLLAAISSSLIAGIILNLISHSFG
jgi:hypothetical protein